MAPRSERRRQAHGLERLHGRHAIEEALRARRRPLKRLLVRRDPAGAELDGLVGLAREAGLEVVELDAPRLAELVETGEAGVQGAVLEAGPLPEWGSVGELCRATQGEAGTRRLVVLDGVEDPQNVGSIARVADAAGAAGLVLARRRSPPLTPAVARASAGAIEWLPVARVGNLVRALEELKDQGFWILAADPSADQELYEMPDKLLGGDVAVLLGAEGRGLRPGIQGAVDHPIRLPMGGHVASLNVATAAAVLLYELLRRRPGPGGAGSP